MRELLAVVPFMLGACATAPAPSPYPYRSGAESFVCRNTGLDRFVGQPGTQEIGQQMLTSSGSKVLRWLTPGQMVTMEFRADRLSIHLDSQGRIERAVCG